jgi:FtsZ-binding cell division protein ZapB
MGNAFEQAMRTLDDIRIEIEELTERRAEVMHELSRGHDAKLAAEHQRLEERIAELWDEQRAARAQRRWGDRELIIKRARAEERLERAA